MDQLTEIFGEPISSYTAEQAEEDGVLVKASPETHPGWMFTRAVFEAIMARPEMKGEPAYGMSYKQRVVPLLLDVQMICRKHAGDHMYAGTELDGNLTGQRLWFAVNDCGGITVMFPDDY